MAERKIEYRVLSQQADVGVELSAPSLERLFVDIALAVTDYRVSLDLIRETERREIKVSGESKEKLLVNWLTALLTLFNNETFLCRRIVFQGFDGKNIQAAIQGETYVSVKHGFAKKLSGVRSDVGISYKDGSEPCFLGKVFLLG